MVVPKPGTPAAIDVNVVATDIVIGRKYETGPIMRRYSKQIVYICGGYAVSYSGFAWISLDRSGR